MNWYHASESGEQFGPANEAHIKELIASGEILGSTPVWNDSMEDWQELSSTPLGSFIQKRPPPPPPQTQPKSRPPSRIPTALSFNREEDLVYPSNPPRSPHMAWLNLFGPGIVQILFGKTTMGVTAVAVGTVLNALLSTPLCLDYGGVTGFGMFISLIYLLGLIASIVDGYMTGNRLREGQPVGKWQVFPLRTPPQS